MILSGESKSISKNGPEDISNRSAARRLKMLPVSGKRTRKRLNRLICARPIKCSIFNAQVITSVADADCYVKVRYREFQCPRIPRRGWAEMIRKVYEVDPLLCPERGGEMKIISFLTDYAVVDKIIDHIKLTFIADKPPPPHIAHQKVLIAAEAPTEYSS